MEVIAGILVVGGFGLIAIALMVYFGSIVIDMISKGQYILALGFAGSLLFIVGGLIAWAVTDG